MSVTPLNSDASSGQLPPRLSPDAGPASLGAPGDSSLDLTVAVKTLDGVEAASLAAVEGGADVEGGEKPPVYVDVTYMDIAREFSILGYIGFGGPAAHIGLFQKVRRC